MISDIPRLLAAAALALAFAGIAALVAAPTLDGPGASAGASSPEGEPAPTVSGGAPAPSVAPPSEPRYERVRWRESLSLGDPSAGALRRGVQLSAEGEGFFTWDPVLRRAPNRPWRRWAADGTVRVLLAVLEEFHAAHPGAPRIGVGDLSRPEGGDFGARYGLPGHASHQNGLDLDLYYPRRDRLERAPTRVGQVDRALSQDLVSRFVRAGAVFVFVGPNTGLRGPGGVVQHLPHHDNHLHVRLRPGGG